MAVGTTTEAPPGRFERTRSTPAPSHRESRAFDRFPFWLRIVDAVHANSRSSAPIATEFAAVAACGVFAGLSVVPAIGISAGVVAALYLSGRYTDRSPIETQGFWVASETVMSLAIATLIGVVVAHAGGFDVGLTLRFGGIAVVGLLALRSITWVILAIARRAGAGLRRTLIVGDCAHAEMLARKLRDHPRAGLLPVAILPSGNGHGFARFVPEFPNADQLAIAIAQSDAEHVVLAPNGGDKAIMECLKGSTSVPVAFSILPPFAEFFLNPGHVAQVGGLPLIPLGKIAQRRTSLPGKRLFDIVVASFLLLLLFPIMGAAAICIRLLDRGPILYRQDRVGQDGRLFSMLKFRSMVVGAERLVLDLRDQNMNSGLLFKIPDDPRVTRVGRLIRRLSIDELPQLWNVVRGEMSLVGPRPLPVRPEDFNAIDNKRHTAPPGITGYWQTAGDHSLSYEEMIRLDLAYIANWSLWLDVRLLVRTIPAVLNRRGPS